MAEVQRLIFFTDPMCSWCWGFAPVLHRLIDETGYHCWIVAGGLHPHRSDLLQGEQVERLSQVWSRVAEASGQPFTEIPEFPEGFCYDTEPACRALVAARELDESDTLGFLALLQEAFYTRCADLTDETILNRLYADFRPDRADEFAELLASRYIAELTTGDFRYTREQLGIASFPTLVADLGDRMAHLSPGYNAYEDVRVLLRAVEQR